MIYRGQITKITDKGMFFEVPELGKGYDFGPSPLVNGARVKDHVIVARVGSTLEDVEIIQVIGLPGSTPHTHVASADLTGTLSAASTVLPYHIRGGRKDTVLNWNTDCVHNGFYCGAPGSLNTPEGAAASVQWWIGWTITHDPDLANLWCTQFAQKLTGLVGTESAIHMRQIGGGTINAWKPTMLTRDEMDARFAASSHSHVASADLTGTLADAQLPARLRAAQTNNTITDPNLAVETGFHYVNTGTGGPGPTDYFLSVVAYNTSYVTQFATDFRTSRSWRRQKSADVNAGAWSAWALIANQREKAVFQLNTAGTDYSDAALEVRNDTNYPSIAFHKAGAYAPQIRAINTQTFQVVDQFGTSYIDFKARDLYSSEVLVVKTNDSRLSDVREPNLNTVNTRTLAAELRSQGNVTGGGTVTHNSSGQLRWTERFIVIANGRGTYFGTDGFFNIDIPADGTVITGVGGAANQTVVAGGIPITTWHALYYILPIGSNYLSQAANFRLVNYQADLDIPPNWFLIAVRNSDAGGGLRICTGVTLDGGRSSTAVDPYQQYAKKAGDTFTGRINLKAYRETRLSHGALAASATLTLDPAVATFHYADASAGAITVAFAAGIADGDSITLRLFMNPARAVTWPAGVLWQDNAAPTLVAGENVISFWRDGTSWFGSLAGKFGA